MGKALKYFGILILLVIVGLVAIWYLARGIIEDSLKTELTATVQTHITDFDMQNLKLHSLFPISFEFQQVQFSWGGVFFKQIPSLHFQIGFKKPIWKLKNSLDVKLQIESLDSSTKQVPDSSTKQTPVPENPTPTPVPENPTPTPVPENPTPTPIKRELPKINIPWPIDFKLFLGQGRFTMKDLENKELVDIQNIQINAQQFPLLSPQAPINFNLKMKVATHFGSGSYQLPIQAATTDSFFDANKFSAKNLNVSISGLEMIFKEGFSDFSNGDHNWTTAFDISDLSRLPNLPDFLPPGKWQGSMKGRVQIEKKGKEYLNINASLNTSPIVGELQIDEPETKLSGIVKTQFQTSFKYDQQIKLENLIGYLDLSNAQLKAGQFFAKEKGVPLKTDIDIQFTKGLLQVKKFKSLFYTLKGFIVGNISQDSTQNSNLKIEIPSTSLAGYEKFIPALNHSPMRGQIGLDARLEGHTGELKGIVLNVNDFHLKNMNAFIDYQWPEKMFTVKGPIKVNSEGALSFEKLKLKKANLIFDVIGDQLDIKFAESASKKPGGPLRINAKIMQQKNIMTFKQTQVKAPGLDVVLDGNIKDDQITSFSMAAKLNILDKAKLEKVLPFLTFSELQPVARGNLRIEGSLDPTVSLTQLPFFISGGIFVKLPIYKITRLPATQGEKPISVESPPPQPLLPNWPMFKNANLQVKSYIDHFYFNNFHLKNLKLNSLFKGGVVALRGVVEEAYGGQVKIDSFKFNALEPQPESFVELNISQLNIESALKDLITSFNDEVSGSLNMLFRGKIPYPYGEEWQSKIMAKGSVELKNGDLKTFLFDKKSGDILSQTQGIGNNEIMSVIGKGVIAKSKFSIAKKRILINELVIKTPEDNEFAGNGFANFDLNTNLSGTVHLSKPPVRNSIILANRDKKGRFFTPVMVSGNLLKSDFIISRESLDQLLSNAIRFEARRTQQQSLKALEEQAKKNNKQLDDKTKKRIKGLFEVQ